MDHMFRLYMEALGGGGPDAWAEVCKIKERILAGWRENGRPRIACAETGGKDGTLTYFFFHKDQFGEETFVSQLQAHDASEWFDPEEDAVPAPVQEGVA